MLDSLRTSLPFPCRASQLKSGSHLRSWAGLHSPSIPISSTKTVPNLLHFYQNFFLWIFGLLSLLASYRNAHHFLLLYLTDLSITLVDIFRVQQKNLAHLKSSIEYYMLQDNSNLWSLWKWCFSQLAPVQKLLKGVNRLLSDFDSGRNAKGTLSWGAFQPGIGSLNEPIQVIYSKLLYSLWMCDINSVRQWMVFASHFEYLR